MSNESKKMFLELSDMTDEMLKKKKKINTRVADKNLVILHEKEQK